MIASILLAAAAAFGADAWLPDDYVLRNIAQHVFPTTAKQSLPIVVPPFEEHVRGEAPGFTPEQIEAAKWISVNADGTLELHAEERPRFDPQHAVTGIAVTPKQTWYGAGDGLYYRVLDGKPWRYDSYGSNGPISSNITALAYDNFNSRDTLWVGTQMGISRYVPEDPETRDEHSSIWVHFVGRNGLPVEHITALAAASNGDMWLGAWPGAILYRHDAEGRKWFYRQGRRYLAGDIVRSIAVSPDNKTIYFLTDGGLSTIEVKTTTLLERAQAIESRLNERHRREGMVAACMLDDAHNPTAHTIHDNDNDGLWTAYHVAAMSLAFGATKDEAAKKSAAESMHALYLLQNASGIPGLAARSVVSPEIGKTKDKQWQPTPDGKWYWKSDTSSDEIDGHYLAFYTYFEHIAQHDPAERKLIDKQVRAMTDYIVGNGYRLIDWNGKRTRWGFWDPESLNHNPMDYTEAGLNSLQILSFLKVAHYITGDNKYHEHYRKLAVEHHYLENVMLTKKAFPLENNHSDDQLGFVAWYPILQLEKDPKARQALLRGVAYHYEVVRPEQPSFYTFAYATINPGAADLLGAVENLRQIPTDRRTWAQNNMHRADVEVSQHPNRFGKPVLTRVLPADERVFEKWNADPYVPDDGGDGRLEDDGAAYLLPYWMGRYHGFIAEQQ